MTSTSADDIGGPAGSWRSWATIILLGALYFMSFVDRIILALLVQPLKDDLGIDNVQLGLLFGTAFAVFYGVLGLPLARVADRSNRKRLIVAGAVLWSLATMASGFATSFAMLVILRVGLAVGEAALSPAAYSMIGDLFPASSRSRAASIYSGIGMLGTGSSYIIGAALISHFELHIGEGVLGGLRIWQLVLLTVGTPALILALLFALVAHEPKRPGGTGASVPSLAEVFRMIWQNFRFYGLVLIGAGLCQVPGYSLVAWLPTYVEGRFGYTAAEAGYTLGPIKILCSALGAFLIPVIADTLARRWDPKAIPFCSVIGAAGGMIAILLASIASTPTLFLIAIAAGLLLLTGTTSNIIVSFQHNVSPRVRGTMSALCLMAITLLGMGIGPPLLAALIDMPIAKTWPGSGIAAVALAGAAPAAVLLFISARAAARLPASAS